MKKLIGSISVALTLALSVFGLAACDLVNFNWGTGSDHEHHFTEYEATDPTCTKNGNIRYFKCDVGPNPCGRYYIDLAAMEPVSEESVMIPALGHEYDFTNIVWSEWNGKEITASVTCTQCDEEEPGHVLHPEITVKFTQTKAPTCTAKGAGYYTASFTYEGETYTNPTTNAAEVDMIPHTYNKEPDDGWKWADDHTSASATFTCTAADCTHKETVTVSGAAITSKVETIKGVCTDGSQTVYTATAEFNGETYDLTDTVVTLEAINEHTAGDWQYDTEGHWHKCQNGDHAADEKQPHQVDPATHKCECGYVEESYTFTTLTLAANAENTAAILTIGGTYTGYDQQGLTELFCEKNAEGNYFFNFWGDGIGRENAKSVTLTKWENGEFSVALDVTDLPVCELRNICRTDLGDQDWKLSTETIQETTITVGEKVYTLQPSNGHDWNNIGLEVASKTVEKAHTITDAVIAEKDGKVYVTVTGTYAGYANAAEFLADLQDGQDTTKLGFCVFKNSDGWGKVIDYDSELIQYSAKDDDGNKFTVQIDVTDLPARGYQIGHDYSSEGDIKTVNYTGTAETATKTYELVGNTGNLTLTIKEKQAEVDGTFTLTGVTLEVDTTAVYVVYKGTHTCTDPAALKAKFEAKAFEIYVKELIPESNRTVTVDATTWTIKANVSSMNLADGAYYIWFNGDSGPGDIRLSLEAAPNITKTFGEKDYSIENHYGEASDNPHFWGCVILRIAPTKGAPTYEITKFTIEEDGNGKFYLVYGGTCENYEQAALQTALKADLALNVHYTQESNKKASGEWVITANQTEWTAKLDITVGTDVFVVGGKYYIDGTNGWDSKTFYKLWPAVSSKDEVQVANENYIYTLGGQDGSLYSNVTFTITAVAPAKTATFGEANVTALGDQGARVLLRITTDGFTAEELTNIKLVVGTEEIAPNETPGDGRYYFLVSRNVEKGVYTLKVKIGEEEFETKLASSVTSTENKAFCHPSFYTLALTEGSLILTVYKNEDFTITSITMEESGEVANLVLAGTYDNIKISDDVVKSYLQTAVGFWDYAQANVNAQKEVTAGEGNWTLKIHVSALFNVGDNKTLIYGGGNSDITFTLGENTEVTITSGDQSLVYALVNQGASVHLTVANALKSIDCTAVTLETTADKVYLVFEGNSKGYDKDTLGAALRNTDTGDASLPSFGFWHDRFDPATLAEVEANDGVNWTVKIDITDFSGNYSVLWQNKSGGDAKGPDGFEAQTETLGGKMYSLNGSVGVGLTLAIVETSYTDPDSREGHTFGTKVEADMAKEPLQGAKKKGDTDACGSDTNPNTWIYWYVAGDWDGCGTRVESALPTIAEGKLTFTYKGGSLDWSVQLFYNNTNLTEGKQYYLSMTLNSSVDSRIKINNKAHNLKAGDNEIGVIFTLGNPSGGIDAIDIQFPGTDYAAGGIKGGEITYTLSNVAWEEVDPASVGPVDPEVPEVKITEVYGHMMDGDDILVFNVKGTLTLDQAKSAVILANGSTELTPYEVTQPTDYFCFKTHIGTLEGSESGIKYTLTLKIGDKTFALATADVSSSKTDSTGKTYTLSFEDDNLVVTVSKEAEKKVTDVYNPNVNQTQIGAWFQTTGYTVEELKAVAVLTGGPQDVSPEANHETAAAGQFHLFFNVGSFTEGIYTLKAKVGEQTWSLKNIAIPEPYTVDGKTFTFSYVGEELQLTVAAVVPAADGSQDAPFSVSDLAAIFDSEDLKQEGETSYYKGEDGQPKKVYIGGYIKEVGSTNTYGFTQIVIEPTQAAAAGIALAANELNEILIYSANYNKIAGEGMTFKVGDYIVVYGYIENFYNAKEGTYTQEIGQYNDDYPTIESFRSVTPEEDAEAAFQEINGKTFTVSSTLPLPTFTTRPGVTYKFEVQSEGSENLKINEQDGVFEVLKRSKEQDLTITVNVTISVAGQEGTKSTTITVTIPKDTGEEEITYEAESTVNGGDETIVALNEAIEITFSKGTNNSSKPKYYASGNADVVSELPAIRCYANNTITVSGKDGATILSVTIVFGVNKSGTLTTSDNAVTSGEPVSVGKNGTGALSIEFKVGSTGQIHIASIKVTYKPGKTLSPDEKIDAALKEINIEKTEFNDDFVLPTTIVSGVTLTWSVEGGDGVAAKIDETNTKLLIVPQAAEVTFTLVVEASCNGGTPVSKKFEDLKVSAKTAVTTYTLVTSEEDLEVGAKIVFVSGTSVCGGFQTGKGRFNPVSGVVISSSTITTLPQDAVIWTVGGESGAWTFSTQGQYMQQTSDAKDKMALVATTSDSNNTQWTLTSATGNTWKIQCKGYTASYFQFSGSYFSSFTSGQKNPSIYVAS